MILDDLCDYLSSGGITEPIYAGYMPDKPDYAVALYETPGLPPVHAMNPNAGQAKCEYPRIQVRCRSTQDEYPTARTTMHSIFKLLDGMPTRSINGTAYKWAQAIQSPFSGGRDDAGRVLIFCNFDVVKELHA